MTIIQQLVLMLRTSLPPAAVGAVLGGLVMLFAPTESPQVAADFMGNWYPLMLLGAPITLILLLIYISRRIPVVLSIWVGAVWGLWVAFIMTAMYPVGSIVSANFYSALQVDTTAFYNLLHPAVFSLPFVAVLLLTAAVGFLYARFKPTHRSEK